MQTSDPNSLTWSFKCLLSERILFSFYLKITVLIYRGKKPQTTKAETADRMPRTAAFVLVCQGSAVSFTQNQPTKILFSTLDFT